MLTSNQYRRDRRSGRVFRLLKTTELGYWLCDAPNPDKRCEQTQTWSPQWLEKHTRPYWLQPGVQLVGVGWAMDLTFTLRNGEYEVFAFREDKTASELQSHPEVGCQRGQSYE